MRIEGLSFFIIILLKILTNTVCCPTSSHQNAMKYEWNEFHTALMAFHLNDPLSGFHEADERLGFANLTQYKQTKPCI